MSSLRDDLFLFSLEGALCGPDGQIAPANAEMLRLLALRGGRYSVVSDRTYDGVRAALAGLPPPCGPVICSSGAVVYDLEQDRCLARWELLRPDAETLLWTLERAFPALGLAVQIYGGPPQIIRANWNTEEYLRARGFGGILIQLENVPDNWLNAAVFAASQQLDDVEEFIARNVLTGDFQLVRRSRTQMLMLPRQVSVALALERLCCAVNVPAQDIHALGGMAGDGSWLGFVGKSAAAADAPTEVKLAADVVLTCTAADGAAAEFLYQSLKQYE